ncbi:MAG: C1 family peptidase [Betaproteobacteria bacterium]
MKYRFGWRPDLPDARDKLYRARVMRLPARVDLRAGCSAIEDQATLSSCVGNALAGAIEFNDNTPDGKYSDRSRLFIYWNARDLIRATHEDAGCYIRDGIKSLAKHGVCDEAAWPYKASRVLDKPPRAAYTHAKKSVIKSYERIVDLAGIKSALARGFPVTFGFSVYDSFVSEYVAKTGLMPMPSSDERMQGGHAVLAVGYDDANKRLIVRNSWGTVWGDKGYCYMPYAYITPSLSDDFWVVYR